MSIPTKVAVQDFSKLDSPNWRPDIDRYIEGYWAYLRLVADSKISADLRQRVGASDVVQETMLAAHRERHLFRGRSEPELRQWLLRILTCNLVDAERAQRRRCRDVQREVAISAPSAQPAIVDPHLTPGRRAMRREESQALAAALAELPWHYRQVIELRGIEGYSFDKIARRTGRSAEAVRHIWVRAVKRLSHALADHD